MTEADFNRLISRFVALTSTLNALVHDEYREDGTHLIHGFIDSVQWIRSDLYSVDVDNDGVAEDVALHWVNIRWTMLEDARVHLRCIRSVCEDDTLVQFLTIEGRRLDFFNVDDDPASKGPVIEILRWRERNRAAYDDQTEALLDEAKGLVGYNLSN